VAKATFLSLFIPCYLLFLATVKSRQPLSLTFAHFHRRSVIGEVASIAGIIGLAGQTLQAACSVYNLLKAYKRVHPRVLEIQAEIARLKEALEAIARLTAGSSHPAVSELNNLRASVLKCGTVLENLRIHLQDVEVTSAGFFKKLLKKAKIAADVEYFSTISHQIQLCRADVSLDLQLVQR
jgi:hypothetical protein